MSKKDLEIKTLQENYKMLKYSFDKLTEEKVKINEETLLPAKILLKPIHEVMNIVLTKHKSFTYDNFLYLLLRLEETIINECLKKQEEENENYL